MKKENERELVEFKIDDKEGNIIGDLSLISIVFEPAIEKGFHLFSKDKKYSMAKVDPDKKIIVGPAMLPNKKILRYDESNDTYFDCFFSEETVRKCSELFLKNSNHTKTNLEHGELLTSNQINGAYVTQSWIVEDPEMDTAKAYGFSPVKGEWYVAFKIENDSLWNIIKENGFSGFSVEGIFAERFFSLIKKEAPIDLEAEVKAIIYDEFMSDEIKEEKIKNIIFSEKTAN